MAEGESFEKWVDRAVQGSGRIGTREGSVIFMAQLTEFYPVELEQPPERLDDVAD